MVAYRQTYEIIRGIQEKAAEQCAPVIFGIKPSNLLIIDQCYASIEISGRNNRPEGAVL